MASPGDPRLIASLKRVSKVASAIAIFVGGLVLLGWTLNIGILKSVLSGLAEMTANYFSSPRYRPLLNDSKKEDI